MYRDISRDASEVLLKLCIDCGGIIQKRAETSPARHARQSRCVPCLSAWVKTCASCGRSFGRGCEPYWKWENRTFCSRACYASRPPEESNEVRFWRKVTPAGADHCWIWNCRTGSNGYATFWRKDDRGHGWGVQAHRMAWELLRGDIPAGLVIDHLCRAPLCMNPWHMEPVTIGENTARARGKSKYLTAA